MGNNSTSRWASLSKMNNPTPCGGIQLGNKNGKGKNISSVLSIKEAIKEGLGVDLGNEIELISDFFKESLEISPTQLVRFLKESVGMGRETSNLIIMVLILKIPFPEWTVLGRDVLGPNHA